MAKIYILQELGYSYNDEYYERNGDSGEPIKAFRKKKNAEFALKEMTEKQLEDDYWMVDGENQPIKERFIIKEVEVEDKDVVTYDSMRKEVETLRAKATKLALKSFYGGAKELFDANPELQSFGWKQYTDYFNDGDAVRFRAHTDEPDINEECGYDLDNGETWDCVDGKYKCVRKEEPSVAYKLQKMVSKFLRQFANEDMVKMFGDHVEITMRRGAKKAEVEDYTDHD